MKHMIKQVTLLGLAAAASLIAMDGRANSITWTLGTVVNGATPTSASPWMTAVFTDVVGADPKQVKVTFTSSLDVDSEFIDQVAFNVNPDILPSAITIVNTTTGDPAVLGILHTTQDAQDITGSGNAGKGYDIIIDWGNDSSGSPPGVHRFNGTDIEEFTFTLSGLTVADFAFKNTIWNGNKSTPGDCYIVAHVQGIPVTGGTTSGLIRDGTVPDGGTTALLLGMATLGLGFLRRK